MFLSWWKRRRRRKLLAQPFPAEWLRYLEKNVAHYRHLSPAEQAKLRDDLRIFIAEKNWEGCGGLHLSDEMKVTIAAHACLMVLGMDVDAFERVLSVLVYPSGYSVPEQFIDRYGLAHEGEGRLGEAHYRGPVVLSWDEIKFNSENPHAGRNLVFHEFAHQLDALNGALDGTPRLKSPDEYRRWETVMAHEHDRLVRASAMGRVTLLDEYGTQDEAEFFAVATECFFDRPVDMARRHRKLYDLLRDYYGQDPAARCGHREPVPEGQDD